MNTVKFMNNRLDDCRGRLVILDSYWYGEQALSYLASDIKEAMRDKLHTLPINYPRLVVTALAERLTINGFKEGSEEEPDSRVWDAWKANAMQAGAEQSIIDALVYGRSYIAVWADSFGQPVISVESARQMTVIQDPLTGEVKAAWKRTISQGKAVGYLYTAEAIVKYTHPMENASENNLPEDGWNVSGEPIPNPLGVVPVVPIINQTRLLDIDGVSEMKDVLDPADALNKLMADMMSTSEYYARPRRWATGLEIDEDENGKPVKPFSVEKEDLWTSESPDTKFGEFKASTLQGYTDAANALIQQIGAMGGLPPHYLGISGDQPPSADSIRSAEASLVSRAYNKQRLFGPRFARVAALIRAILTGEDVRTIRMQTLWASPETRTQGQSTDAASKLVGVGVPLEIALEKELGYTPADIAKVRAARRVEALDQAGVDWMGLGANNG